MLAEAQQRKREPLGVVLTGEAEDWVPALETIVGRGVVTSFPVRNDRELIDVVQSGLVQAAVLDEEAAWSLDVLQLLRMIRRVDALLPVVVLSVRTDRTWLEDALQLEAFSVVVKPLELEELLRQLRRIMIRLDQMLRRDFPPLGG
jgi:DNA-binding NtrC family response regulator